MLRSRRGVRLGIDENGDDELAAMLGTHVPGAHPRDEALYTAGTDADTDTDGSQDGATPSESVKDRVRKMPFLQLAPRLAEETTVGSVSEVSTETREVILSGEPTGRLAQVQGQAQPDRSDAVAASTSAAQTADSEEPGPSDSEVAARLERKAAAKPKRSSVPSWDEIVFGTKGD
ncbi:hypothetical protein NHF46_07265 [Arthrobacter alpinus]|nr:hypothetical protein [Arthrobacter alpinus]